MLVWSQFTLRILNEWRWENPEVEEEERDAQIQHRAELQTDFAYLINLPCTNT